MMEIPPRTNHGIVARVLGTSRREEQTRDIGAHRCTRGDILTQLTLCYLR